MINVSNEFKEAMKKPVKELDAYIKIDEENKITSSDDLIKIKVSADGGLCKTVMKKFEASLLGEHDLLNKKVHAGFGVKLPNEEYEYLDFGTFTITEVTTVKDTEITSIVGYDNMVESMKVYTKLEVEYPVKLFDYTKKLEENNGIELSNTAFSCNGDYPVNLELWENISGITYRDINQQIAQATSTIALINNQDELLFKDIKSEVCERLTYDNLKKLKLEPKYGPINSIVLSRTPQEDNVYKKDEESVEINGLTEFKIENNEIIDKDRDTAMQPIFDALNGVSYYPFEATTEGLGWLEIGDLIEIETDTGQIYPSIILNYSITIDGGITEEIKSVAHTKTETQYQYASTLAKRVKNAEIVVNKQEQYIESLVTDMYDENGIVHENFTSIYQNIENIINSVQNSGGSNLLLNSVMFAYDSNNKPNNWTVEGNGSLTMNSNSESLYSGCLSGHSFTLNDKKVRQRVYVKVDSADTPEDEKVYYTFSTKIKKNATGSCYVKIYNDIEEYKIDLIAGTESYYKEYEIKELLPKSNYYDIEFYGSADSNATYTDNMFAIGKFKTQWTQASGEIMNTQVNININGIIVKSSVYAGDYTIMSPLEFAGYSNLNGVVTKVFSLNKDITKVKKLEAEDEINMPPIKIVPVKSGDLQGWHFVKSD